MSLPRTSPFVLLALCLAASAGRGQYFETTIPCGYGPMDILWNPISNKVYVANLGSEDVTIIDGATNQVIATVDVLENPAELALNTRENKVYVACGGADGLVVIDGVGDTLIRALRVAGYPARMAYCASLNKLYVGVIDDSKAVVFDAGPDTVITTISLGVCPYPMIWVPTSNRVFCAGYSAHRVVVIDCVTDQVVGGIDVLGAYGLLWNPANNLVYIAGWDTVCAVTADGDSLVATIPTAAWAPWSYCFAPYPNRLFVNDFNPGSVTVIDCDANTVVDTLSRGGGNSKDIVVDTCRGKLYCIARGQLDVWVYDARTDTFIASFWPGSERGFHCMAWNSTESRVYVTDGNNSVVCVLRDTSTGVGQLRAEPTVRYGKVPTIVRSHLDLQDDDAAELVDVSGRPVARLVKGRNDISRTPPGVYVLVAPGEAEHRRIVLVAGD